LADCHYYPKWAEYQDVSKYCFNHVQMTSKSNFKFSVVRKTTPAQILAMEKESNHFEAPTVDFSEVQVLLNSNKYLHIADPIGELARYLQVSKKELIDNIDVRAKSNGFVAILDPASFKQVKLDVGFKQIDEIPLN
jgi:hypothetical protein